MTKAGWIVVTLALGSALAFGGTVQAGLGPINVVGAWKVWVDTDSMSDRVTIEAATTNDGGTFLASCYKIGKGNHYDIRISTSLFLGYDNGGAIEYRIDDQKPRRALAAFRGNAAVVWNEGDAVKILLGLFKAKHAIFRVVNENQSVSDVDFDVDTTALPSLGRVGLCVPGSYVPPRPAE